MAFSFLLTSFLAAKKKLVPEVAREAGAHGINSFVLFYFFFSKMKLVSSR